MTDVKKIVPMHMNKEFQEYLEKALIELYEADWCQALDNAVKKKVTDD